MITVHLAVSEQEFKDLLQMQQYFEKENTGIVIGMAIALLKSCADSLEQGERIGALSTPLGKKEVVFREISIS